MATTVNNDLIIYNEQAQTAYLERIQDVLDVFNASSQGAIVLRNEMLEGDFTQNAFYTVPGAVGHRDVNSTAPVVGQKLGADEMVGVKTPWKYGPYETTEEAFKRRARSPEEFSQLLGQHMADATLAYMIAAAFAALSAAIGANANMVATGSWATDGKKVLTKGMRKFGDRFNRIAMFGMDSSTYFDLVDNAIDTKVYEEAGVVIYGGQPGTMASRFSSRTVSRKTPSSASRPAPSRSSSPSRRAFVPTTSITRRTWRSVTVAKARSTWSFSATRGTRMARRQPPPIRPLPRSARVRTGASTLRMTRLPPAS